jgi:hypothetical protein
MHFWTHYESESFLKLKTDMRQVVRFLQSAPGEHSRRISKRDQYKVVIETRLAPPKSEFEKKSMSESVSEWLIWGVRITRQE